jgi:parallel beta-helix repeat protein
MKNIPICLVVVFILLSSSIPFVSSYEISSNNIIYVDDDGGADYTRIQDAIDNASDGDTIFVYSGFYKENIIVNKSIILQGEDRNYTIIDGNKTGKTVNVIVNNVKIFDFTLQNSGHKALDAGINAISNFSSFSGNILVNNGGSGIFSRGENNIISKNNFQNNSNGIKFPSSKNNTITKNIIMNNVNGIESSTSNHNEIKGNNITNNHYGIIFHSWYNIPGSENNSINYNNIIENDIGIYLSQAKYTSINKNNFYRNEKSASFWQSTTNNWDNNYWDKSRIFPKIIIGKTGNAWFGLPWINIDWHPAEDPFDIREGYN